MTKKIKEYTAQDVVEWLKTINSLKNIAPIRVGITYKNNVETFNGASYILVSHYTKDMDGVIRGQYKAGQEYEKKVLYLLGPKPECAKKVKMGAGGFYESSVVYKNADDPFDWYVSSWYDINEVNNYHPFGRFFMMSRWDLSEPIDHYETVKRERATLSILEI